LREQSGSEGTASTTSTTETHEQLVSRLSADCEARNIAAAKPQALFNAALRAHDLSRAGSVLDGILPQARREAARLDSYRPPPQDASAFASYRRETRRLVALYERLATALRAGDAREVRRFVGLVHTSKARRIAAAIELGTTSCAD
jgi:hypothetical protein